MIQTEMVIIGCMRFGKWIIRVIEPTANATSNIKSPGDTNGPKAFTYRRTLWFWYYAPRMLRILNIEVR
ncbi:MAG: hypothetical protein HQL54_05485 [Magnetococcales bacterium]|nr:hypothetical protein [Magnetococcales bacterium]